MGFTHSSDGERCLVARCLVGNEIAWYELVESFEPNLRSYILKCLRPSRVAGIDVDDIIQAVWCSLVSHRHRLAAFRPERAKLAAFLNVLASDEIQQQRRRAQRGKRRVVPLTDADTFCDPKTSDCFQGVWMAEIQARLSPEGKSWLQEQLGVHAGREASALTPVTGWQRTHRLSVIVREVIGDHTRNSKEF